MMLIGDDMDADVVTQPILIEHLVIEACGHLGFTIFVGQAGPHRVGLLQHLVRNEGVRILAVIPQFYLISRSFRCVVPASIWDTPFVPRHGYKPTRHPDAMDAKLGVLWEPTPVAYERT